LKLQKRVHGGGKEKMKRILKGASSTSQFIAVRTERGERNGSGSGTRKGTQLKNIQSSSVGSFYL